MNDASDIGVLLKDGKSVIKIAQVYLIILYFFAGNFFNAFKDAGR